MKQSVLFKTLWGVLLFTALTGLIAANYRFVVQNPGGNDFVVHWVGARALLFDGISPYNDEVAIEIQTWAYGRPAQPGEHELRVAYPLYSSLIFTPFALVENYDLARALWMTVLEIALAGIAILCLRVTKWRPGFGRMSHIWGMFVYFLFAFLWYHSIRPLINGNAVILVTLLVTGAIYAIQTGRDAVAGVFLAIATIKPQLVVLLVPFVLLWAVSRRRPRILLGFVVAQTLLLIFAFVLIPDWLSQNLREVLYYPSYNPPGTPGAVFDVWWPADESYPGVGRVLGWLLTATLAAILLQEWRLAWGKEFRWFLWTACLTLVFSQWIGVQTDPGNFILVFLPIVLVFARWRACWGKAGLWGAYIAMLVLFVGVWALFLSTVEYGYQPQQSPMMFFPVPLFLVLGLYSSRRGAMSGFAKGDNYGLP